MCWNEKVSWTTFLIGSIFSVIGWSGSKTSSTTWLYVFFQLVLFVQFGEALVWKDITERESEIPYKKTCGYLGKIGSVITFFSVWLQPLLGMYLLTLIDTPKSVQTVYAMILIVYMLSSISNIRNVFKNCYKPVCNNDCSHKNLEFSGWNNTPVMGYMYTVCIVLLILAMYTTFPVVSGYVFVTMFLSAIFYKNTFGSMWCWFSAFTPLIAIFYTK
jgi:hypothetical protein